MTDKDRDDLLLSIAADVGTLKADVERLDKRTARMEQRYQTDIPALEAAVKRIETYLIRSETARMGATAQINGLPNTRTRSKTNLL